LAVKFIFCSCKHISKLSSSCWAVVWLILETLTSIWQIQFFIYMEFFFYTFFLVFVELLHFFCGHDKCSLSFITNLHLCSS
jgi:hypothetical protein